MSFIRLSAAVTGCPDLLEDISSCTEKSVFDVTVETVLEPVDAMASDSGCSRGTTLTTGSPRLSPTSRRAATDVMWSSGLLEGIRCRGLLGYNENSCRSRSSASSEPYVDRGSASLKP